MSAQPVTDLSGVTVQIVTWLIAFYEDVDEARVQWVHDDELVVLRRTLRQALEECANAGRSSHANRIALDIFKALPHARILQVLEEAGGKGAGLSPRDDNSKPPGRAARSSASSRVGGLNG